MWPAAILEKRPLMLSMDQGNVTTEALTCGVWMLGRVVKERSWSVSVLMDLSGDCWHFPPFNMNFLDKRSCDSLFQPGTCAQQLLPVLSLPFCHCSHWFCSLTWKSGSVFDTFGEEKSITNCCNNQGPCCSKESSSVFSTFHYNLAALPGLWDASFEFSNKKIFLKIPWSS